MDDSVNLADVLRLLKSGNVKDRGARLEELKYILDHNTRDGIGSINSDAYHKICEVLFTINLSDQSSYYKSNSKSAAAKRLSDGAQTLRHVLRSGVTVIRTKALNAVLDHLTSTIQGSDKDLCEPLCLDYARCLQLILSYAPHVEHLQHDVWNSVVCTCINLLRIREEWDLTNPKLSDDVADALWACLQRLTSAPNAPITKTISESPDAKKSSTSIDTKKASTLVLDSIFEYAWDVTKVATTARSMASTINNILDCIVVEDIRLVKESLLPILRIVRKHWNIDSKQLKDELLGCVTRILPFLTNKLIPGHDLFRECRNVYEVMFDEYDKRPEKKMLRMDEVLLHSTDSPKDDLDGHRLAKRAMSLAEPAAGGCWSVVSVLADLAYVYDRSQSIAEAAQPDRRGTDGERPSKRPRMTIEPERLLNSSSDGISNNSIAALQTKSLLRNNYFSKSSDLQIELEAIILGCASTDSRKATWSYVAVASLACQDIAADPALSDTWCNIWQMAMHSISRGATCRAACHTLNILYTRKLDSKSILATYLEELTLTPEEKEPATLCDSSLQFMYLVVSKAVSAARASKHSLTNHMLRWLLKRWHFVTPSVAQRMVAVQEIPEVDLIRLIAVLLAQECPDIISSAKMSSSATEHAVVKTESEKELHDYLLQLDRPSNTTGEDKPTVETQTTNRSILRTDHHEVAEGLLLKHIDDSLPQLLLEYDEMFTHRPRALGIPEFTSAVSMTFVLILILYDFSFGDEETAQRLRSQCDALLSIVQQFASSSFCSAEQMENLQRLAWSMMCSSESNNGFTLRRHSQAAKYVATCVDVVTKARHNPGSSVENVMSIGTNGHNSIDLSQGFSGAGGRSEGFPSSLIDTLLFSLSRSTKIIQCASRLCSPSPSSNDSSVVYNSFDSTGKLDTLSDEAFTMLIGNFVADQEHPTLEPREVEQLLEAMSTRLFVSYKFNRSEPVLAACVDFMTSTCHIWTDTSVLSLHNLGLDMYEWLIHVALSSRIASPAVEQKMAALLLALCRIDPSFGSQTTDPSARTHLFRLLNSGPIQVQFYLSSRIPLIFGLFSESAYGKMFDDLQESLPREVTWLEGIAMRLLVLAELAVAWRSLLRQCVYYIFETAGRITESRTFATACMRKVSSSLSMKSSTELFNIFGQQMLYTWLESHQLQKVPYTLFEYSTRQAFLLANQDEIVAQLFVKGDDANLSYMAESLRMSVSDLLRQRSTFAKVMAYGMSRDITQSDGKAAQVENRLREVVGGKEELKRAIKETYPTIIGHILRSANVDNRDDKWLEKRETFVEAASALLTMRKYSNSTNELPSSQQPHYKVKYLADLLERLSRRLNKTSADQLWCESSYTIAAQMILQDINPALESLHNYVVLEKLRLLIALAGPTLSRGSSFESTIRAVVPLLDQTSSASDAIGIIRHVVVVGFDYASENWSFTLSMTILMVLQICKLRKDSQNDRFDQSQASQLVSQTHGFKTWLLTTAARLSTMIPRELQADSQEVLQYLETVSLPGNSTHGSAESKLLLFLLRCANERSKLIQPRDAMKAIHLLTKDFNFHSDQDCLQDDSSAIQYASSMWNVARTPSLDERFRLWAMNIVSRAYAASGDRDIFVSKEPAERASVSKQGAGSEDRIADAVKLFLCSDQQQEVTLATYTLRSMLEHEKDNQRVLAIRDTLPSSSTFSEGTFGYIPAVSVQEESASTTDLSTLLSTSCHDTLAFWTQKVALLMCRRSFTNKHTMLEGLTLMLQHVDGFAETVLPQIIHIVLRDQLDVNNSLRDDLAASCDQHFTDHRAHLLSRQQYLFKILLYLKTQTYPSEKTLLDRLQWIPCQYLVASACAVRCNMPSTALQLAELATSPKMSNKRSSRVPVNESIKESVSNELLLSIFISIDEIDSYYGVEQTASLTSFTERSEYEGNSLQALYLRTGQLNSQLSDRHRMEDSDSIAILSSLSRLNLHGVTLMLAQTSSRSAPISSSATIDAARMLQQWDVVTMHKDRTAASQLYQAMFSVVTQSDPIPLQTTIHGIIHEHMETNRHTMKPSAEWLATLVALTDINDIVSTRSDQLPGLSDNRYKWMELAGFDTFKQIILNRPIVYGAIADNADLLRHSNRSPVDLLLNQAKALAAVSKLARIHNEVEAATSAAFSLEKLSQKVTQDGLHIDGMVQCETSAILWQAGEQAAAIKILQAVVKTHAKGSQDIPIGLPGLLSQIGEQLSEARLEKPADILRRYLRTAITTLELKTGREAGNVYFTFARFCDAQLQSSAAQEDFKRISMLRQSKLDEVQAIRDLINAGKKSGDEKHRQERALKRATQWFKLDDEEYQRLKHGQDEYVQYSLTNYMLALKASDDHNACILRLFALWLENHDSVSAQSAIDAEVKDVPSWKFVLLMNQLLSRLKGDQTPFQKSLLSLIQRICQDHTYHTVHHIYASRKTPGKDPAAQLRRTTAENLAKDLAYKSPNGALFTKMLKVDSLYKQLAEETNDNWRPGSKVSIRDCTAASKIKKHVPSENVPPATIDLLLQPDGVYKNVPTITDLVSNITVMSGLSAPKVLTTICSNGKHYKQLFKGGNDDLRQDAIMEQVFGEVSKMLVNHKATRQRNLHVRTYKVIPLTNRAGIIEFVPNSMPINEFLQPAHSLYFPSCLKANVARQKIGSVADHSTETRVKEYRRVCEQMPPVMRFFFFERYQDPDEWFEKRTAYTRSTATISMLGQVLGLGDRHCQNILLDEQSGEVVHIDLGVAFETGRVLPIPELVPFRLTRDIVDGMGVTGVEGVFKRCCEFTLEALREDKDGIMTLLNVLRYDPLYVWTLSPLQARRMQQGDGTDQAIDVNGAVEGARKTGGETAEATEAQRALAVVEKKLGKALSASATVSELIQQARDERNLATLFNGWAAFY